MNPFFCKSRPLTLTPAQEAEVRAREEASAPKWPLVPSTAANTGDWLIEEYAVRGLVGRVRIYDGPGACSGSGFVAVAVDHGNAISGTCETIEEARQRIERLITGQDLTEAPEGQANEREMRHARDFVVASDFHPAMIDLFNAALAAGIHTVPWAVASREAIDLADDFGWDAVIGPAVEAALE